MDNVTKVVLFKRKTKEACENRPNIKQPISKKGKKRIKKYAESFQRDPKSLITKVMKSKNDETWKGLTRGNDIVPLNESWVKENIMQLDENWYNDTFGDNQDCKWLPLSVGKKRKNNDESSIMNKRNKNSIEMPLSQFGDLCVLCATVNLMKAYGDTELVADLSKNKDYNDWISFVNKYCPIIRNIGRCKQWCYTCKKRIMKLRE